MNAKEFLKILKKSNLLPPEQIAGWDDCDPYALVHEGVITRWQAQQLLAGNSQFFLGKYQLLDKLGEGGM
ncbi:MAG: hypothetical protein N2C14_32025, partial [Planctomycetales bacterium]